MKIIPLAPLIFFSLPLLPAYACETSDSSLAANHNHFTFATTASPRSTPDPLPKKNSAPPAAPRAATPKHNRATRPGYLFM